MRGKSWACRKDISPAVSQCHIYHWPQSSKTYRATVPPKCKLPPSRETRLISLEMSLVSLETSLVSLEKFLVSRECTVSTNALPSGECTNGIIEILFRAHLQWIHVGIAFVLLWNERLAITIDGTLVLIYFTICIRKFKRHKFRNGYLNGTGFHFKLQGRSFSDSFDSILHGSRALKSMVASVRLYAN